MNKRSLRFLAVLALCLSSARLSFALPGEMVAVIHQCGAPTSEDENTSPVTNKPQHDLIYNHLVLHFEPDGGGWSFTTAWYKHLPMTREELERKLPCFRTALSNVAAAPQAAVDPTIAAQTNQTTVNQTNFGIPHLWLLIILVIATILIVLIPRARRRRAANAVLIHDLPEERRTRKPLIDERKAPESRIRRDLDNV